MSQSFNQTKRNNNNYQPTAEPLAGIVPPQAIELEEAVLGALMLEKDSVIAVQEYITPDSFYTDQHKLIYKAIEGLSRDLRPIDLYTVTERLRSEQVLNAVGGAAYLSQLTQKVGSAANVEFHARIVAQKYVQRELINAATHIQKNSYDETVDVTELIEFAESQIFRVAEGHIKRSVQSANDILQMAFDQIEEASKSGNEFNGVPSGFTEIDKKTLGWQPSDLIIVAARPSMGKTAFVLTMARNMAVDYGQGVAFFSLEMSSVQLMMRLIMSESELPSALLKTGRLTHDQWAHMESSTRALAAAQLYVDDTPALSIFEFRSKARRLKIQHDIKIIIIDYLQLMTGSNDTRGNREQEVSFISRTLKAIAKDLNIPIIALSQLSRATEARGGSKRPMLSDLRESGAIEQDADIVAFIHRPEYYGQTQTEDGLPTAGMAEIILAKHRNGEVCDVPLRFIKEQARFADLNELDIKTIASNNSIMGTDVEYDNFASEYRGESSNIPHPPSVGGLGSGLATGRNEFDITPNGFVEESPF